MLSISVHNYFILELLNWSTVATKDSERESKKKMANLIAGMAAFGRHK